MNKLEQLKREVESRIPGVKASIDSPSNPLGWRFLDVLYRGRRVAVEWSPMETGFGLTSIDENTGWGDADEDYPDVDSAAKRLVQVLVEGNRTESPAEVLLHELRARMGMSQVELAKALSMTQPTLSRIERRRDMLLSTLRRLVEGLGGKLEISARFPTGNVHIAMIEPQPASARRPPARRSTRKRVSR